MAVAPSRVLIADDGELGDLRAVLGSLGVAFAESDARDQALPEPGAALLFTTARHALRFQMRGEEEGRIGAREHVVVIGAAQRTLGSALERSGCDFVLREPVHPEVYRLLVERALYRGSERRRHPRVAFGETVDVRIGRRTSSATLSQLSRRGCGLLLERPPAAGTRLSLTLPPALTGGEALAVEGQVTETAPGGRGETPHTSVVFGPLGGRAARRLRRVLFDRSTRGATLVPQPPKVAGATAAAAGGERRASPRVSFPERVLATGRGSARVLTGRDLSRGGMRVHRQPDLTLGEEFKLALYGRPGRPPILVRATVARDAGSRGLVLHFRDVPPRTAARLDEIVASLPTLEGAAEGGPAVVVSEIVDGD